MALISIDRIASELGLTRRTVEGYLARGCPRTSMQAVREWRKDNVGTNGPPTIVSRRDIKAEIATDKLEEEELRAKIRKLDAEAEAKELKNAQLRGELYEAAEVERQVAELTGMIRCRLEGIPDELQTEWPPDVRSTVTQRLSDKIHLILTEMSQWRLDVSSNVPAGDFELPPTSEAEASSLEPGEHTDA